MATIPFPYGIDKATGMRLGRVEYHTSQPLAVYDQADARRERAELARAFRVLDDALRQIERRLRALEEVTFP
jgi:hypothetical protein